MVERLINNEPDWMCGGSTAITPLPPSELVRTVTLLLCIREVVASNIYRDTRYSESSLRGCPPSLHATAGLLPRIRPWPTLHFLFNPLFTYNPTI